MTESQITLILADAERSMKKAIDSLQQELARFSTKASSDLISNVLVDCYGTPTPVMQIATVSTINIDTITIRPLERTILKSIEKSISEAHLGVILQNDGQMIRLTIPKLTEQSRLEMVKKTRRCGEDAKASIKRGGQIAIEDFTEAVNNGLSEDIAKQKEAEILALTKQYTEQIGIIVEAKVKNIMTV